MSENHTVDRTAEADADVAALLGAQPPAPKPVVAPPTTKEIKLEDVSSESVRKKARPKREVKEGDANIANIPLELRRRFYTAMRYGDGRVEWSMRIGSAESDTALDLAPVYATFVSKGGAEVEVMSKIVDLWQTTGILSDPLTCKAYVDRIDLALQLKSYALMSFELPPPKDNGEYDVEEVLTHMDLVIRKLATVPFALAIRLRDRFNLQLQTCILSLDDGSFMKTAR